MHALTHPRSAISPPLIVGLAPAFVVPIATTAAWWHEVGLALALAVAGVAAVVDAETSRIPDPLVLLAALPTAALVVGNATLRHGDGAVIEPLLGLLAFAGPLLALHLRSPAAIGFGDVKLAAVLGAALGSIDPRTALVALSIATAVTALFGIVLRRPSVPLGPGLVAGAVLSLFVTAPVLEAAAAWH